MKVVYIGIILLVCIIQSLIGNSHGKPNGSVCSTISCGDNKQCYEYNGRALCLCLPNSYRNYDTDECVLKYQWVEFIDEMMNDTTLVGFERKTDGLHVIGRLHYNHTDKLPGDAIIKYDDLSVIEFINIPYPGFSDFEVLRIYSGHVKWQESEKGKVGYSAIEGGNKGNETIYVCRIHDGENYRTGWMQPSKNACLVQGDLNFLCKHDYELLVLI